MIILYVLDVHEEEPQRVALDGKIPFPLMTKREIFIRCNGQMHGSRGRNGHRDVEDKGMFPGGA
jgi:hypothetical protein